ncbi:solute carrier family 25 member 53 [Rhinophrynus dorsalis]
MRGVEGGHGPPVLEMQDKNRPHWGGEGYFVGATSTFLTTVLTFPIYKTIFRQQLHTLTIRAASQQLVSEGIVHLYRGLAPPLLGKTVQGTLLFGTQDHLQHLLSGRGQPGLWHRCLSGLLSGGLEAVLLVPLERIQNILQDGRNNTRFPCAKSILQEFLSYSSRERLASGFYRGFTAILVRNSLGSALYLSLKEPLRDVLSIPGIPAWVPSLGSGAVNGALTSLVLYPLCVLVTNMQAGMGKELPPARKVAIAVWAQCGGRVSLLYRGASLIVLRSCITWGMTTLIHDALTRKCL